MRSVVLYVTGNSHTIGDIPIGECRTTIVEPTADSNLEIEFTDDELGKVRVNAGGYFEPGYRGTVWASADERGG